MKISLVIGSNLEPIKTSGGLVNPQSLVGIKERRANIILKNLVVLKNVLKVWWCFKLMENQKK